MAFRLQVPWDHSVGENWAGDKKPHVCSLIPGWTVNAHMASSFPELLQHCPRSSSSGRIKSVAPGPGPAARGWDCFLSPPLGSCTPQVGLYVEMSNLQRKKSLSDNFERENPVAKMYKDFCRTCKIHPMICTIKKIGILIPLSGK